MYLSTSEGSRGIIGVHHTAQAAILGLRNYVRNCKERLLIAAHTIEEDEDRETPNEYKNRKQNERKTQQTQKHLMGNLSCKQLNNAHTEKGYKNQDKSKDYKKTVNVEYVEILERL